MTRPATQTALLALLIVSLSVGVYAGDADLVTSVRALAAQGQYSKASGSVRVYEAHHGESPESILALSWLARTALAQKKYDLADQYAQETKALKKSPLDREPDLPLVLGASLEVQGQVLAARGQRTEAISMLEMELRKYPGTPLAVRIRKNINLLSLEGKSAPALEGVALPGEKPALLFFWAHWCGDCRAEAPILAQIRKEFGPRGLSVIGATRKYGYIGPQTNVPPRVEISCIEQIRREYYAAVLDAPAAISEADFLTYGVSTTPTIVLLDRGGIVRLYHPGGMKYEELKTAIEGMISKPSQVQR